MLQKKSILVGLFLASVLALSFASPALASSPSTATFSGTATIHIVEVDGTQMTLTRPFRVVATAGGAGVGTLLLTVYSLPAPFGTVTVGGTIATGSIAITSSSATGGGTIAPPEPSQDGFGVTASSGGQFQCQNAGFSALLGLGIRQMDVHGTALPGSLMTS